MSTPVLQLYQIGPSPNTMKVRIALNYKGIAFEPIAVDPQDRRRVVELSGQPLTPVLLHGTTVVYDSAAILRYVDANFRGTPALFAADRDTMKEIEGWELFARAELGAPVRMVFNQYFSTVRDAAVPVRACAQLTELTDRLEERLSAGDWLVGDRMTAADVTAAPAVYYAVQTEAQAGAGDLPRFFFDHLQLGAGRPRTRAWVQRVMAYC